jgi:hypothetical protein
MPLAALALAIDGRFRRRPPISLKAARAPSI